MLYNLFENRDFVSVFAVALLAEGVDRNHTGQDVGVEIEVALLAEGVDRNNDSSLVPYKYKESPSSRRAWIEIGMAGVITKALSVALLAEGVDRNCVAQKPCCIWFRSPSSRRAWIEMVV